MEIRVFTYQITDLLLVLATARIIDGKCYVSYCYAESQKEVEAEDIAKINLSGIEIWAMSHNGVLWSY